VGHATSYICNKLHLRIDKKISFFSLEISPSFNSRADLLYDEYLTETQECLVVVSSSGNRAAAVCCFRNDADVEYFVEDIPECCLEAVKDQGEIRKVTIFIPKSSF
jgi:hypothetical protein